jgi:hypothetical protein
MDDKRDFMAASTSSYRGLPKLHEAEARGLEETIIWVGNMSLSRVYIELDYKQMIYDIHNKFSFNFKVYAILHFLKFPLVLHKP